MTQKNKVHQRIFSIVWGDMDALGHVNNARYFDYFQEARIEWLATLNIDLKKNTGPVVIHTACTYLKPVIYPATLVLDSSIHSIGRSSFVIDHDLFQNQELMAQGISKVVWVDYKLNKSIPIPDEVRNCFS
ncbi:acyl-CoA thioesterase [Legionella genomosp. 1]|uniref:acyl-CoA thioesterase n=1 Tax=Legionella genomosp. 1 TaxID=1093625 RepID=UPI00105527EF|nr:thioesterase family protein [Legionella genomosp. 1]